MPTRVDVSFSLGFSDTPHTAGSDLVGAVKGNGIKAGGMHQHLVFRGMGGSGPFEIYDGTGVLKGTLTMTQRDDGNGNPVLSGVQKVTGGEGRWAGASGTLKFSAKPDAESIPGATVVRGTSTGTVSSAPAPTIATPAPRKVDVSGDEATSDLTFPGLVLGTAAVLKGTGLAPGVIVYRKRTTAGSTFGATFSLYTARGILRRERQALAGQQEEQAQGHLGPRRVRQDPRHARVDREAQRRAPHDAPARQADLLGAAPRRRSSRRPARRCRA